MIRFIINVPDDMRLTDVLNLSIGEHLSRGRLSLDTGLSSASVATPRKIVSPVPVKKHKQTAVMTIPEEASEYLRKISISEFRGSMAEAARVLIWAWLKKNSVSIKSSSFIETPYFFKHKSTRQLSVTLPVDMQEAIRAAAPSFPGALGQSIPLLARKCLITALSEHAIKAGKAK